MTWILNGEAPRKGAKARRIIVGGRECGDNEKTGRHHAKARRREGLLWAAANAEITEITEITGGGHAKARPYSGGERWEEG